MMGEVDGTEMCVPGGGAPFTSWSRLDILGDVEAESYG